MIRHVLRMRALVIAFLLMVSDMAGDALCQEEAGGVRVELMSIGWEGVIEDLKYESEGEEKSMTVYSRGFAPPVKYRGNPVVEFFRTEPAPEPGDPPVKKVVGRVSLPAGANRALLFFRREETAPDEVYQIVAMNNDVAAFPEGGFRFFNFTRDTIVGSGGGRAVSVGSGKAEIVRPSGDENGNFEIRLGRQMAGGLETLYSSVWTANPRRRTTVFLLPSGSRIEDLEVRKFVENMVLETPEP